VREEARHVVIAGTGASASLLALELLRHRFAVTLLARPSGHLAPGIEALSEGALLLLRERGLADVLRRAGTVVVRGFENGWESPHAPRLLEGWWAHVERTALARALLEEAVRWGARVREAEAPARPVAAPGGRGLLIETMGLEAFAAVDATGRTAFWSRPVRRAGQSVAALYRGPGVDHAEPGRLVRLSGGWAWHLAHPGQTTVGVVLARGAAPEELPGEAAATLGIGDPATFELEAYRPAHAQWAEQPLRDGILSVGDAALAYEPLAGQGLRFALGSALAAATTLEALREGDAEGVAACYYRTFVESARRRHLEAMERLRGGPTGSAGEEAAREVPGDTWLRFGGTTRPTPLNEGGVLRPGEAILLPDGGLVRWVGAFDLLRLRELAAGPRQAGELRRELEEAGLSAGQSEALLRWSTRQGVLVPCAEASAAG
jgi:flavin-dependent dehydrogenase